MVRVFPRRTSFTPVDGQAFVGYPPLIRPKADEVHISCTFTWDIPLARLLTQAWAEYYPVSKIGGPAIGGDNEADAFVPGRYVRNGVTFTSRGCNHYCPWCLVPRREGRLRELPDFHPGNIIQDNNLLQCSERHLQLVLAMLRKQKQIQFSGGLESERVTDKFATELRGLRIGQVFLAADTDGYLKPLESALQKLAFLGREKLRCYVLLGFNGENIEAGEARLRRVWELGAMPFAQLYQPPGEKRILYAKKWQRLAHTWSRPAAMKAAYEAHPEITIMYPPAHARIMYPY